MKTCSKCKESKALEEFNKRSASPDGRNAWCKVCLKNYERERYQNGDRARKERNRDIQLTRKRVALWTLLKESECKNCGNKDPEVLEFDHREPTEKSFDVSEMMWSHSWESILTEIAKCDILCANCHRKRTIQQFGLWRGVYGCEEDGNPLGLGPR